VTLIRLIPERHRSLVVEIVTFGTVGVINTVLGQVMFNVFFGLGYLTSTTISTAMATVCSYVLNRHVTYRHRPKTSLRRELPLFTALNLIALGMQLAILAGAKHLFDLNSSDRLELNIARFGAVIVCTVFLLITYRTFVFKKAPVEAVTVPAQAVAPADEFAVLTEQLEAELENAAELDSAAELDAAELDAAELEDAAEFDEATSLDTAAARPELRAVDAL
jgi:putative flippase GtrA